jgi:hypothetical protein
MERERERNRDRKREREREGEGRGREGKGREGKGGEGREEERMNSGIFSYEDINPIETGSHPYDFIYLNYLHKGLISKLSHIED